MSISRPRSYIWSPKAGNIPPSSYLQCLIDYYSCRKQSYTTNIFNFLPFFFYHLLFTFLPIALLYGINKHINDMRKSVSVGYSSSINIRTAKTSRSPCYTANDLESPNLLHANLWAAIGYIYIKAVPKEKSTIHFRPCVHRNERSQWESIHSQKIKF